MWETILTTTDDILLIDVGADRQLATSVQRVGADCSFRCAQIFAEAHQFGSPLRGYDLHWAVLYRNRNFNLELPPEYQIPPLPEFVGGTELNRTERDIADTLKQGWASEEWLKHFTLDDMLPVRKMQRLSGTYPYIPPDAEIVLAPLGIVALTQAEIDLLRANTFAEWLESQAALDWQDLDYEYHWKKNEWEVSDCPGAPIKIFDLRGHH